MYRIHSAGGEILADLPAWRRPGRHLNQPTGLSDVHAGTINALLSAYDNPLLVDETRHQLRRLVRRANRPANLDRELDSSPAATDAIRAFTALAGALPRDQRPRKETIPA